MNFAQLLRSFTDNNYCAVTLGGNYVLSTYIAGEMAGVLVIGEYRFQVWTHTINTSNCCKLPLRHDFKLMVLRLRPTYHLVLRLRHNIIQLYLNIINCFFAYLRLQGDNSS